MTEQTPPVIAKAPGKLCPAELLVFRTTPQRLRAIADRLEEGMEKIKPGQWVPAIDVQDDSSSDPERFLRIQVDQAAYEAEKRG